MPQAHLGYDDGRAMTIVLDWLNLFVRWVHVIAAIMWIGDSFL
ncbi:MAG: urate hydroxylase PuuD, partial [Myxococcaceae bacterium]|nr:urate hydroxylase PuuD [Myxococcaceae bacterium]